MIVYNTKYSDINLFKNKISLYFNYSADYFIDELKAYIKTNDKPFRILEYYHEFNIVVMSKRDSFLKWEEIIICKITRSENNHTYIEIFFNFEDDGTIESLSSYFKKLDLLNFNYHNN